MGNVFDFYDNAFFETINGLFKTEVVHHQGRGPWKTIGEGKYAPLDWLDWFNRQRPLESIGDKPPDKFEALYYAQIDASAKEVAIN